MECRISRGTMQFAMVAALLAIIAVGCRAKIVDSPNTTNLELPSEILGDVVEAVDSQTKQNVQPNETVNPVGETTEPTKAEPPREFRFDEEEAARIYKPSVVLSSEHERSCLCKVGDEFPALSLPDFDGDMSTLSDLFGEKLTLVVFWNQSNDFARGQFAKLNHDVIDEYFGTGLQVVAINVGDSSEDVKQLAEEFDVSATCLLDKDGKAFSQIATTKFPRTYLLDSAGKVVWFDIEYSRDMRRELRNAILFSLFGEQISSEDS